MSTYQLSHFGQDHLDQAVMLSQAEQWPHRREDWDMLCTLSQGVAAMRDAAVVGTTLRSDYGPDVSMMNMIIVARSERGQGLGRRLMKAVMDTATDRELRLVATELGIPLYEKLGFRAEGEIAQCQGMIEALDAPVSDVVAADVADIEQIIEIDRQYIAADRSALLRWLGQHGTLASIRADGGEMTGYAALRRFGRGHVIGPIVVPELAQAKDLIRYLAAPLSGEFIRIDTDTTLGLCPWLDSIGLKNAGGGAIMRKAAKTDPRPVFGLCSQALG